MSNRRDFLVLLAGTPLYVRSLFASPMNASQTSTPDPVPGDLAAAFIHPPEAARPYVLWMWMGCNISQEGITADLEAMKDVGIGGATIFSLADTLIPWAGVIGKSPTPEIVTWTEPWWAMVHHAASECRRLRLDLILHNCAGYESSGGTWITPELAMQEVIWSERKVEGGKHVAITLDRAVVDLHPHSQFPELYIPSLGKIAAPIVEGRKSYYRDIAVIAMPVEGTPSMDQVLDLTGKMNARGELAWDAPALADSGAWSIYRFGHTTTGSMIQPAQWDAIGLECDKMSKDAVTFHVQHVLGEIKKHLGDLAGPALSTLYFDSYEAGVPTWTPKMAEEFKARRGYGIIPWLPVFAGRTLESKSTTDRFHADFDRTVKDLYRDCYWSVPRALAHEAGLQFVAEPYEGPWEIEEVVKFLDHANMEFWTDDGKYKPTAAEPIARQAHSLDQRIVGAEAFTTQPQFAHWDEHPAWLKPIGDAAFCDGVNRFNMHHFVQQPWGPAYQPGNAMGQWGVHFGRYQTWWEPGKAWVHYLWRCQTLLQSGTFIPASQQTSVTFSEQQGRLELQSIHRRHKTDDIYFIANLAATSGSAVCTFPITGMQPELWDPVWGTMRDLPSYEQSGIATTFRLTLEANQSFFIIFRKAANGSGRGGSNFSTLRTVAEAAGVWTVHFDPAWGGPPTVEFPSLIDWTEHKQPGIKYYSGTATYKKNLTLQSLSKDKKVYLSLGVIKHLATVTVNGKRLGVLWTAPWRIDITSAAVEGENTIEIAVTNVWANRLIGDEQEPEDVLWQEGDPRFHSGYSMKEFPDWFLKQEKRPSHGRYTFTTWNYFHKDSPLVPSGLLGPVEVMVEI